MDDRRSAHWLRPLALIAFLPVTLAALVACAGDGGEQAPVVGSEASYEAFQGIQAMNAAAEIVFTVDGLAAKTDRIYSLPSNNVDLSSDGKVLDNTEEIAVYEVSVAEVSKGAEKLKKGDRLLVVPAVDSQAYPPRSQAALLETTEDATLYLVPENAKERIWTTLTPYEGVIP